MSGVKVCVHEWTEGACCGLTCKVLYTRRSSTVCCQMDHCYSAMCWDRCSIWLFVTITQLPKHQHLIGREEMIHACTLKWLLVGVKLHFLSCQIHCQWHYASGCIQMERSMQQLLHRSKDIRTTPQSHEPCSTAIVYYVARYSM